METATADGIVKITKSAKAGIPPAFSERCVVRVKNHKFGPNSNGNPMITLSDVELIGYFKPSETEPGKAELVNTVEKGGQKYILNGLELKPSYFTLKDGGLEVYATFWNKANPGQELTEVNTNNPDREYLTNLLMQVIVSGRMEPYRRQLTEEEKAEKKAQGKRPVGDPILDEDGKPIELPVLQVTTWLRKYSGDLPEGTAPV